ncbi:uncharacterized protein METZ01_LOCUS505058, partial [marine metagenome]
MISINTLYNKFIILVILLVLFVSCDKLVKDISASSDSQDRRENTLDKSSLGQETANIQDYFYDFNNNINAHFNYHKYHEFYEGYGSTLTTASDDLNPEDTLNFRTFPEFLLDLTPDSLELKATL